jgi:magnesium chelatase family protein
VFTSVCTFAVQGIDAMRVWVEVDVGPGLPAFEIVGLPDAAVREARERVRAALRNSGFAFPPQRIVVNLAPSHTRKEGAGFDLPIALGILAASGQAGVERLAGSAFVGELALDGSVRPVAGSLALALAARAEGMEVFVTAGRAAAEAALAGLPTYGIGSLGDAVRMLGGEERAAAPAGAGSGTSSAGPDLADIRGQLTARRALEVAGAGGHNLLMMGPPGAGKSLLAAALPSLLPPLTDEEALEVSRIHSIAGTLPDGGLMRRRPFRAPHHSATRAALLGGGCPLRPGEITLAHRGVLFLDELPEFSRDVLEGLRQPVEEGSVKIARTGVRAVLPASVMLVAAANPCPCGYLGHPERACICPPGLAAQYRARLSGPLVDRFDLQLYLHPVPFEEYAGPAHAPDGSEAVARRVLAAHRRQYERTGCANARLTPAQVRLVCTLAGPSRALLREGMSRLGLSLRACDRLLRLSRTIADLEGSAAIEPRHLAEALQYRQLDRAAV